MTLPRTLEGLMAMGRDLLIPCVRLYCEAFGIGAWDITARWCDDMGGNVGSCQPDPVYHRATIEVLWPPVGDVEETIAHEVAHAYTSELALLAGVEPGSWGWAAWERIAEQTARGAVALRRNGQRVSNIVSRLMANRARVIATMRRTMDPSALAAIAVEGGAFTAREDVPEDVKNWIMKAVEAMAGGDGMSEPPPPEMDPMAAAPMPEEDKPPQYMRALEERLTRLEAARSATAPQVDVNTDLKQRQILTRTILAASRGVLSPEMERQLVERGDHDVAEQMIGEVRRHVALAARNQGSGAMPPKGGGRAVALSEAQKRAVGRHRVDPERYAAVAAQRTERAAQLNGGRKV